MSLPSPESSSPLSPPLSPPSPTEFEVVFNNIKLTATVTNRSDVAASWIQNLLLNNTYNPEHLIVGISTTNTNTSPNPFFFGSNIYNNHTIDITSSSTPTLQLCCQNKCLIFSLLYNDHGIPNEVVDFLFDRSRVTLVGAGIRRGGDWLGRPGSMLVYRDPWEIAESRAWRGVKRLGTVEQLAGELLGREMVTGVPVAGNGWPLTENQRSAACLEAYLLAEIGKKLAEISRETFGTCYFMYSL